VTIHPLTQALIDKGVVYATPCCPDKLTRPSKYKIADAPGTIKRKSSTECANCSTARRKREAREDAKCWNELEVYIQSRRARGIPPEGLRYQAKEPLCVKQPGNSNEQLSNSSYSGVTV
jgi:hypothetical protein